MINFEEIEFLLAPLTKVHEQDHILKSPYISMKDTSVLILSHSCKWEQGRLVAKILILSHFP